MCIGKPFWPVKDELASDFVRVSRVARATVDV